MNKVQEIRDPKRSAHSGDRQNWLLVFNCQAMGLANCLMLLNDGITVSFYDEPSFLIENKEAILSSLHHFHRVLLAPAIETELDFRVEGRPNVWRLPPIYFSGYHPDSCNLSGDGALSRGPLGHYHSTLVYAAFRCGLDVRQTLDLFGEEGYFQLGYFDRWALDRDRLLKVYDMCGFDIRQAFVTWSRSGPFMHTINHPRIQCLHELAKVILARAGLPCLDSDHMPHDNLANGPVCPVYPEIGARLGVRGSYRFKGAATYQTMSLEQFVVESFDVYRNSADAEASIAAFFPAIENCMSYVRATR